MRPDTKPLYRKVNTRTHGVRHGHGGESRWDRGSKAGRADDRATGSMHSHHRHGRDYTPLFRFLLSRVGRDWDAVLSEAVARLDDPAPVFWLVALHESDRKPMVTLGQSSHFSGLYVDGDNRLAKVDPTLDHTSSAPFCACCTHTFNGQRFSRPFTAPGPEPDG